MSMGGCLTSCCAVEDDGEESSKLLNNNTGRQIAGSEEARRRAAEAALRRAGALAQRARSKPSASTNHGTNRGMSKNITGDGMRWEAG